jgi:hypothetical protein
MALVIVNPRKPKRRKVQAKRNPAKKRATKGASQMAKKRRSPAQRAATARMLMARNPRRRRRVAVHSNPRRRVVHRRRVANPVRQFRNYRRHRNPSGGGGRSGFFGSMLNKEGLMLLAAVVATPEIIAQGQTMLAPNATGYYASGIKAVLGVGLGWAAWKYLDKQVGHVVALIGVGTAVAELVTQYQAGTLGNSTMGGPPFNTLRRMEALRSTPQKAVGMRSMSGYQSMPVNYGNMNGYQARPSLAMPAEPGVRRIR